MKKIKAYNILRINYKLIIKLSLKKTTLKLITIKLKFVKFKNSFKNKILSIIIKILYDHLLFSRSS